MTYGTAAEPLGLGYSRNSFLWMLMVAVIGFGVMVPIAGLLADAFGRRKTMIVITLLMIGFAFLFPSMLGSGNQLLVMAFLLLGLSIMGLTFGPMGALLPELFPTEVRYTGASFSYNVASILGASVAPYIATWLANNYGLFYVGMYLAAMASLTLIALLLMKRNPPHVSVIRSRPPCLWGACLSVVTNPGYAISPHLLRKPAHDVAPLALFVCYVADYYRHCRLFLAETGPPGCAVAISSASNACLISNKTIIRPLRTGR
ncbi:Inner membrane metabolite transport protein yhjE [Serratia fonticola]|uniref:Inner membrane metabolite transport protein yhjE n=1 Tax=Serratia fonticola TaxID=47917 RepID=A0A4V6Z2D0_SERFO|nr:Inner membrane metabolite transport protein yhjE [Serratia fonticola]